MIYTSYIGNLKNIDKDIERISIMRYTPSAITKYIDKIDTKLAPSGELLEDFKNNSISKLEYTKRYNEEVLSKLDSKKLYKKYDGKVLLCTCKIGNFCHRHLIADKLLKDGYKVLELGSATIRYPIHIETVKKINYKMVTDNPDKYYVFLDTVAETGLYKYRDLDNVIFLKYRWDDKHLYNSHFSDDSKSVAIINRCMNIINNRIVNGDVIVMPEDIFECGLDTLMMDAPYTYINIYNVIKNRWMEHSR
jgi:uncharacterized protein YeaO (DUF488 family)